MKGSTSRFRVLLVLAGLIAGIVMAVWDVMTLRQALSVADSFFAGLGSPVPGSSPQISVTWLFGLIPIGEVQHPYVWCAIGGFLVGAIAGMVLFLFAHGVIRLFRRSRATA
jgi:hypothetical protein